MGDIKIMEDITQKEILESLADIGYRLKKHTEIFGFGLCDDVYEFYSDNNSYTFSIESYSDSKCYLIKHDKMPESFSVVYSLAEHYMKLEFDQVKRKRQIAFTDCEKRIFEIGYRRVESPSIYAKEAYSYTNGFINVYIWRNGSRIEACPVIKDSKYVAFSKTEMRLFLLRLVELEYGKEVK